MLSNYNHCKKTAMTVSVMAVFSEIAVAVGQPLIAEAYTHHERSSSSIDRQRNGISRLVQIALRIALGQRLHTDIIDMCNHITGLQTCRVTSTIVIHHRQIQALGQSIKVGGHRTQLTTVNT